jgi:hypothetical protein
MHPDMASALASQHRHDMTAKASRAQAAAGAGPRLAAPRAYRPGARLPRYRVSWSRTTLSPDGAGGRRGRSWIIVISATPRHLRLWPGALPGCTVLDRWSERGA